MSLNNRHAICNSVYMSSNMFLTGLTVFGYVESSMLSSFPSYMPNSCIRRDRRQNAANCFRLIRTFPLNAGAKQLCKQRLPRPINLRNHCLHPPPLHSAGSNQHKFQEDNITLGVPADIQWYYFRGHVKVGKDYSHPSAIPSSSQKICLIH